MTIDFYYVMGSPGTSCIALTAEVIGVKLNYVELDHSKPDYMKPEFIRHNPDCQDYTIIDNGVVVTELHNIIQYLAEKYDTTNQLYPKDLEKQNDINIKLCFHKALSARVISYFYFQLYEGEKPDEGKLDEVRQIFYLINYALNGQTFLSGEVLTIADIALSTTLDSIKAAPEFEFSDFENIPRYLKACKETIPGYNSVSSIWHESFTTYFQNLMS